MTAHERLEKLIEETDELLAHKTASFDPDFISWEIKMKRFLASHFDADSMEMHKFLEISFQSSLYLSNAPDDIVLADSYITCKTGLEKAKAILLALIDDPAFEETPAQQIETATTMDKSKIFIVHGHDVELKQSVARIIEKQGIEAIILSEQANTGKTIIEKFEKYSDVGCAICLFTADDVGNAKSATEPKPRARQNVVFEAGFFIGKLGRDRIVILSDSGVEIPSDLAGVVYTNTRDWKTELLKELKAMGYTVDFNKLFE